MKTLFISTYNENIIIGLLENSKLLKEKRKESEKSHSIYLIPMIEEILKEENISLNDINEIIVINGPGSFTGIRLGITVAKTLAFTLNIPIKTITSIEAISASNEQKDKIITIKDNKGYYFGIFNDNKLVQEMSYLKETDFIEFIKNRDEIIISNNKLDLEKIYEYSKKLKNENPHGVKAVYIKEIELLNGR